MVGRYCDVESTSMTLIQRHNNITNILGVTLLVTNLNNGAKNNTKIYDYLGKNTGMMFS